MNNCFHFIFNRRTITIYSFFQTDEFHFNPFREAEVYAVQDWRETDAQACYLEIRENGKKLWMGRFSTDILETAACIWVYEPIFKRILLGYGLKVYALEEHTGNLKWSVELDTPVHAILRNEIGRVFVQHELGILKLDMDGKVEWEYSHGGVISQTVMETRQLRISDITDVEYQIDLDSGKLLSSPRSKFGDLSLSLLPSSPPGGEGTGVS